MEEGRPYESDSEDAGGAKAPPLKKRKVYGGPVCEQCGVRASFGPFGGARVRCKLHALGTDVATKRRSCESCFAPATLGLFGTRKALRCVFHMQDGDVNVFADVCEVCGKTASFGPPGGSNARCGKHKARGDVNHRNKLCEAGCGAVASFGAHGTKAPLRCGTHTLPGDVNVRTKHCKAPLCSRKATHGLPGTTSVWCSDHKQEHDVARPSKQLPKFAGLCLVNKCFDKATFGELGGAPLRCAKHSLPYDAILAVDA